MASLPPFPSRPLVGDQPVPRPEKLQLPKDQQVARPPLIDPIDEDLIGGSATLPVSTIDGNVPVLQALRPGAKTQITHADIEQKITETMDQRLGQYDKQNQGAQQKADVDQLVINNIQNDLSGASTWSGPLRNDPWLR